MSALSPMSNKRNKAKTLLVTVKTYPTPSAKYIETRPESYHLDIDSIEQLGVTPTTNNWEQRRAVIEPLLSCSVEGRYTHELLADSHREGTVS